MTHVRALDPADARDHARAGCVVVVHADRRERGQLQERRSGVDQVFDALADGQLAPLAVPRDDCDRRRPRRAR